MFNKLFIPLKVEKDPQENASHPLRIVCSPTAITTLSQSL